MCAINPGSFTKNARTAVKAENLIAASMRMCADVGGIQRFDRQLTPLKNKIVILRFGPSRDLEARSEVNAHYKKLYAKIENDSLQNLCLSLNKKKNFQ